MSCAAPKSMQHCGLRTACTVAMRCRVRATAVRSVHPVRPVRPVRPVHSSGFSVLLLKLIYNPLANLFESATCGIPNELTNRCGQFFDQL